MLELATGFRATGVVFRSVIAIEPIVAALQWE